VPRAVLIKPALLSLVRESTGSRQVTNDGDAASRNGGRDTNRSGGRAPRDGPSRAHARAHVRL
jgi:hypothetical protein